MAERHPPNDRPSADSRGRYVVRPEWIRADAVVNGGLIVVGIYIVQSLLATSYEDLAARVAIVAWAVAIPLLAALGLLIIDQQSYRYASYPAYLLIAKTLAQGSAAAGVIAAFWHVWMPAGVAFAVTSVVALGLYAAYARRLEQDNRPE